MTSRWPLPIFGYGELPEVLDTCRGCGASCISVVHALCSCVALAGLRDDFRIRGKLPSPLCESLFVMELFKERPSAEIRSAHIEFVGRALGFACLPLELRGVDEDIQGELTSAATLDASLRLEAERVHFASSVDDCDADM